jgi:hypothetical protein
MVEASVACLRQGQAVWLVGGMVCLAGLASEGPALLKRGHALASVNELPGPPSGRKLRAL